MKISLQSYLIDTRDLMRSAVTVALQSYLIDAREPTKGSVKVTRRPILGTLVDQ